MPALFRGILLLALALQAFAAGNALAQTAPPLRFESVSIGDGLSSARVRDVLQDRQGFLWVATEDGLNRYDGRRFTIFKSGGPDALSHDQVFVLFEDHAGALWVGTYGGGLNRFDPVTEIFTHYRHDPDDPGSLGGSRVTAIHESPREPGVLWIALHRHGHEGGLDRFDTRTGAFTHYRPLPDDPTSFPHENTHAIHEDAAGTLWVGTEGGLVRMNRATPTSAASFETYLPLPLPHVSGHAAVNAIVEDETGVLWVSAVGVGVQRFDPATGTFARVGDQEPVNTLFMDSTGILWVGTWGGGLVRIDTRTGASARYRPDPSDRFSLGHDHVKAIYRDRAGVLWMGTWGNGLNKLRREPFATYHPRRGLPSPPPSEQISSVAEDPEGGLWVGLLRGGLVHILHEGERVTGYEHYEADAGSPHAFSDDRIPALLVVPDEPEVVWAGTDGEGLCRLDRQTKAVTCYRPTYADTGRSITPTIFALGALPCMPGRLWVGTDHGLYVFDTAERAFTPVPLESEIDAPTWIRTMLVRAAEEPCVLWVSGKQHGLFRLTVPRPAAGDTRTARYDIVNYGPGDSTHFQPALSNLVLLTQTPDGRLWLVGTPALGGSDFKKGLFAFDPATGSVTVYDEADGLPSDFVQAARVDDMGMLWIATNRGLSRMDPATGQVQNFDTMEDLQGIIFMWLASHKGADGTVYFGGLNGVLAIQPERIVNNTTIPPVVLTDFRLFGRSVPIDATGSAESFTLRRSIAHTDALVLRHDDDILAFEFAALDFTTPGKNEYAFMMEGFDEAWREAGTENVATYTNLDPDRYVFRVKGSNNDGVWNEEGASIDVIILPPWWRTWWAYSLYVGFIALTLYGIRRFEMNRRQLSHEAELHRVETEKLQEVDHLKTRFFANISHEFRTPLTLTFGPLDDMANGRYASIDEALPHVERARRNGRRLLRLINQLLDLSKLDAGALVLRPGEQDLAHHLRQLAALFDSIAQNRQIAFTTHLPEAPMLRVYDADKIEKVVVNLLSNAFKFTAPGGKISLALAGQEDGGARIEVADTGTGIAEEHLPHLFDRFYQVESATTRSHEGTGIGLALVKELVVLHGGEIEVESKPGFGTTFTISLPALEEAEPDETPAQTMEAAPESLTGDGAAASLQLGGLEPIVSTGGAASAEHAASSALQETVVLVVEDNADMRAYIRSHLEDMATVVEAENGRTGLASALDGVPDLILSDVMMPEMDGLALCEQVKRDERTSHIPVVLLTARAQVEHRIAGFESGADAYLPKPFNAVELRVRVRALIEERRRLRQRFAGSVAAPPGGDGSEETVVLPPREAAFLAKVEQVVEAHLSDTQFGVERMAEELLMSRRQLFRKLGALTEESPGALQRRVRLAHAAELLRGEEHTMKEVAYAAGFQSGASFSKAFREVYGVPPSEYTASGS